LGRHDTKRVLVIDDEPQIRTIRSIRPDIVLLDFSLPDLPGIEVLKQARTWSTIPFIIHSVRNLESNIVELLNMGAEDYFTKPFNKDGFKHPYCCLSGRDIKLTPNQIMNELWGTAMDEGAGSLRVYLSSLRKKIERDSSRPE
jgi:two-component system, OmpR family, KDP operon response regulator KdpE